MDASNPQVRPLTSEHAAAADRLGQEAFGIRAGEPEPRPFPAPGSSPFGTFHDDQLLAKMTDRHFATYVGDRLVPTAGIAGVTVALEARGQGLLTDLFTATLTAAHARGAALSALHPTAPAIYRKFGFEVVTDYVTAAVPTTSLAAVRAPERVSVRRAASADVPALREVYDAWARGHNGPLSRTGPSFPDQEKVWLTGTDGVTLAEEDGQVTGFAAWNRGTELGTSASLEVTDLYAASAAAHAALLRALGGFASVTGLTTFTSSGTDAVRLLLPGNDWTITSRSPYMLRVLDVIAALDDHRFPAADGQELIFSVEDDFLPWNNGSYALRPAASGTVCARVEPTSAGPVFTPRGLAAIHAGAHSCATLRATGLLRGSDTDDASWDLLSGGRSFHVRDYF